MVFLVPILAGVLATLTAPGQQSGPPPEVKQFSFWVGEWECSGKSRKAPGKDEWQETHGKNRIEMTMDGYVVQENFTMGSYHGMSVSTYNPQAKRWQQTWVDNQGGYIPLSGGMEDGKMILTTLARPGAPESRSRMVFSNIKSDSFDWEWEASTDAGKTWELRWRLRYTRVKK